MIYIKMFSRHISVHFLLVLQVLTQVKFSASNDFQTTLGHLKSDASPDDQAKAVIDLIHRVIPTQHFDKFLVKVNPKIINDDKDGFKIESQKNGSVLITGTTGVAASTGFHHYLKYYCKCHISWEGSQINIPANLPQINLIMTLNDKFRYYQNVCTTSYSFVWWDWSQWEKHIDWMALNSFNLVLAFNGQEAIWKKVYKKLGLTDEEINEHFAGPAFLSWGRMGNVRRWGGPLSESWHNRSINLQKQILDRMRKLGMVPVLPAFSGHVPRSILRIYPNAKTIKTPVWNNFNDTYCCPYLLDPTDPVFRTIGTSFLLEITSEFGTNHVYNCDTFNEMKPPTSNVSYLAEIGKSIYGAMTSVDPKAIWLLQGWMFYSELDYWTVERTKAFVQSVPLGKMIVLDLQSEQFPQYDRLQQYFGQPYIWCMLHNFGGTLGMLGSADIINTQIFKARETQNSTLIGTGLTPEGINQNYVIYDLMSEMSWRKNSTNLDDWFNQYSERRYGKNDTNAKQAWQLLKAGIYNYSEIFKIRGKYVITRSPSTKITTFTWYNTTDVYTAWNHLIASCDDIKNNSLYFHDLVDLTRQVLQNLADKYYNKVIWSYKHKDVTKFKSYSKQFLQIFDDLESILATNQAFLLGNWLNLAKNASDNNSDKKLFEYNARNQITLWGPNGEIKDYANKQWSGLVSDYYKPRWRLFLKIMGKSLSKGKKFDESKAQKKVFKVVERPFTFDLKNFPVTPTGDTVKAAQDIKDRWWPRLKHLKLV